jgi:RNA polymerase sigma-70 factor (ECF subfamily)
MIDAHGSVHAKIMARWLEGARAGSQSDLGRLLESCRAYLIAIARRTTPAPGSIPSAPSDLVQQTFEKAIRRFNGFRGQSERELLAWLTRIMLRIVADMNRRPERWGIPLDAPPASTTPLSGRRTREVADSRPSPSKQVRKRERDETLDKALQSLPDAYRQVIVWRTYEGQSFVEIAERLDRSPEAVRKLWTRGLVALQQQLESPDDSR